MMNKNKERKENKIETLTFNFSTLAKVSRTLGVDFTIEHQGFFGKCFALLCCGCKGAAPTVYILYTGDHFESVQCLHKKYYHIFR